MELKETDPRFFFLRSKVVLFSAIAIIGAFLLLFLVARQRGLFVKTMEVYFITDRATGLYTGMPVKVSGFKIGRLKSMSLRDDARVKVFLSIEASQMKWLREDSFAILTKEGLIGESIIEIIPGNGRNLKPGEEIRFEKIKDIEEMAQELKTEILGIIDEIKKALIYINEPQGSIKKSISNIETISHNLIKTTESLNTLLGRLNDSMPEVTDKVLSIGEKAEVSFDLTQKRLEELSQLINSTRNSIENISKELLETSKNINRASQKTSEQIPLLLEQTRRNLDDLEEVLQSIKGMWPIRTGIKKQEIKPLEGDTYER